MVWRGADPMAFVRINGADIYFETYGKGLADDPPILLIHGSPNTGRADWELVAPLLARRRQVIVPDCRGHGRSTNPSSSYSFREMAEDMAALVRALGYGHAHIVGHSNGGNIALVVLLEHPQVVQSAVLQAANAFVSPDLLEREPVVFDPERVARESPEWMAEMIALHGPTHGADYWRDLLKMTLKEIVGEPNYTPEALKQVKQAVLVIQGENDPVNSPARHAQFIARHIPYAELWTPAGTGHSVHKELLFEWLQKLDDFLDRRGELANEALHRLRCDRYADRRLTIFDLRATNAADQLHPVLLAGQVLTEEQRRASYEAVAANAPGKQVSVEGVDVLLDEETPWALVNRTVTDLRREPRSLAERLSQALLGDPVRILRNEGEWSQVRMERDGYLGWMHTISLYRCTQKEAATYRSACADRVRVGLLAAYLGASPSTGQEAGRLPFGVLAQVTAQSKTTCQVRLPDGRAWWVESSGLLPLDSWPCPDQVGIACTLDLMKQFSGVPYLWGGRSPYGFDCSGFTATFWDFMGVSLPRDADQQSQVGEPVTGSLQPGDLLFFGNLVEEKPDNRQVDRYSSISHVAVSLGGDEIIHANGTSWGVSYNSIDPASPRFRPWLREHYVGARRYI